MSNAFHGMKGYRGAFSLATSGVATLSATCVGAGALRKLDGTFAVFAGSVSQMWLKSGVTWSSIGSGYSLGPESRWRFAQYGDVSLFAAKTQTTQRYVSLSASDITGSPKANLIAVALDFVFLADTVDGTYGDDAQRWWCSALGDYTDWTPSASTQCTTGVFTDVPGRITAMHRLGDQVVLFKNKGMAVGTYQGPPFVWTFLTIPGASGTPSQEAVVSIETALVYMGLDGFYFYDGTRPVRIVTGLDEWFFGTRLDHTYSYKVTSLYDPANSIIYWFYPVSGGGGSLTAAIIYNYKTQRWGVGDYTIESAVTYATALTTYDGLGTSYATYDDLPSISYDSPTWLAQDSYPAVFGTDHVLYLVSGTPGASYFVTGDFGDDVKNTLISRVRPRYLLSPSAATLTNYYRRNLGEALSPDATTAIASGNFDFFRSSKWHRLKLQQTGDFGALQGVKIFGEEDGEE